MRDFRDLSWSDGAQTVLALLPRLTVMREMLDEAPILSLAECCAAIVDGNIRKAVDECFKLTSALINGCYRRVTGNLFEDYILHKLFLDSHIFARMASANRLDEALYNGMKEDLDVLYNLRPLSGETLYRFIQERYRDLRQRTRQGKDSATRLAEAAWGGSTVRPAEENVKLQPEIPAFLPANAPNWHYGEEELRDSYVADEALEEMYHRFIGSDLEWQAMAEDLWNFFAAYGSGNFLRERIFMWREGRLEPMGDIRVCEIQPLLEREYRECLSHIIEFMRGSSSEPLMLVGGEGMGRTTMLFSLADELPETRLIYVPECRAVHELTPLFSILRDQPLKFMVALDDSNITGFNLRVIPVNVLLVSVVAQNASAGCDFTRRVILPQLKLDSFSEMVQRLLNADGIAISRDTVRSACVDHQLDTKGELTVAAAVRVANGLRKQ